MVGCWFPPQRALGSWLMTWCSLAATLTSSLHSGVEVFSGSDRYPGDIVFDQLSQGSCIVEGIFLQIFVVVCAQLLTKQAGCSGRIFFRK